MHRSARSCVAPVVPPLGVARQRGRPSTPTDGGARRGAPATPTSAGAPALRGFCGQRSACVRCRAAAASHLQGAPSGRARRGAPWPNRKANLRSGPKSPRRRRTPPRAGISEEERVWRRKDDKRTGGNGGGARAQPRGVRTRRSTGILRGTLVTGPMQSAASRRAPSEGQAKVGHICLIEQQTLAIRSRDWKQRAHGLRGADDARQRAAGPAHESAKRQAQCRSRRENATRLDVRTGAWATGYGRAEVSARCTGAVDATRRRPCMCITAFMSERRGGRETSGRVWARRLFAGARRRCQRPPILEPLCHVAIRCSGTLWRSLPLPKPR